MKKIFVIVGMFFMMAFAMAADGQGSAMAGSDSAMAVTTGVQGVGNGSPQAVMTGDGQRIQLQAGEHVGIGGEMVRVRAEANNQMRLETDGSSAKTSMKLNQEMTLTGTKFSAQLSNGRNAEIKIMPDRASETALERLRLRTCSEDQGCSIELKEVDQGEGAKLAYEVKTERQSRVLGLFRAKMQVQAQVDAENGEVLRVNKPWWAFLATEPAEE